MENTPDILALLEENRRRAALLPAEANPVTGEGCHGVRIHAGTPVPGLEYAWIPQTMVEDTLYPTVRRNATAWQRLRCAHDFEYWAVRCARIKDKLTGADVPFRLNAPQRRVLAILEDMRLGRRPIRMIMLKARQWGGSTLVQMYMAWIQSCLCRNWNSLICAHVKDTSAQIRGMYTKLLESYPDDLWEGDADDGRPAFKPFERSLNIRRIAGRGCKVTLASAENQEAVRGGDYAMAHLSETAFWPSTPRHTPEQFIRAICGSVPRVPLSMVVIESTANGVGNYFHTEWTRSRSGLSDKAPVFVPWHEIEIYRSAVTDPAALIGSLTAYERELWDTGTGADGRPVITLEMLQWFHDKAREYPSLEQMQAEFPSTDTEAFNTSANNVFHSEHIERLRQGCSDPRRRCEVTRSGAFSPDPRGRLAIWAEPARYGEYVVAVDVGGRSRTSDYSVIAVLSVEDRPRVVAQWRGHIDHDLLVETAAAIAEAYNDALLIVESNTLESEADTSGDPSLFLLNRLAMRYTNLYYREPSPLTGGARRPGFHTNRATKAMIISGLIEAVRDGLYIESDTEACNELATYEQLPNGNFAAAPGRHDDILITRAIALHVASSRILPPHVRASLDDYLRQIRARRRLRY